VRRGLPAFPSLADSSVAGSRKGWRGMSRANVIALIAVLAAVLSLAAFVTGCPKATQQAPASGPSATAPAPSAKGPAAATAQAEVPANLGNAKNDKGEYICPVLKDPITKLDPALSSQYKGKVYYFCCAMCKPKFDADPAKYAP